MKFTLHYLFFDFDIGMQYGIKEQLEFLEYFLVRFNANYIRIDICFSSYKHTFQLLCRLIYLNRISGRFSAKTCVYT